MQNNDSNDKVYALNNVLFSSRTKRILASIGIEEFIKSI